MDFDDLLNPTREALENNPFAEHRSGSPDPWATPFGGTDSSDAFGNHFASSESFGSHANTFGSSPNEPESQPIPEAKASDPLDLAAHNAAEDDDDNEPLAKLRSPGFRESILAPTPAFSETATIRPSLIEEPDTLPTHLEEAASTVPPPAPKAEERSATPITAETQRAPSRSNSAFASPPLSASSSSFKSPLEPVSNALERNIAGLSLGGEAMGGWHAEDTTPWQSEQFTPVPINRVEEEEDSDDDKPVLQTLQRQQERGDDRVYSDSYPESSAALTMF